MQNNQFHSLDVVEKIFQFSENSKLEESLLKDIENEIQFLARFCNITETQAVVFANAVILSYDYSRFDEIFKHLGMPPHTVLRFNNEIKELFDRKLLKKEGRRARIRPNHFDIDDEVIYNISNNIPFTIEIEKEMNFLEFLEEFDIIRDEFHRERYPNWEFEENLEQLFDKNMHLSTVKRMREHRLLTLEKYFFLDTIWDALTRGDNDFNTSVSSTINDFNNSIRLQIHFVESLASGKNRLVSSKFIELNNSEFKNRMKAKVSKEMVAFLKDNEEVRIDDISRTDRSLISYRTIDSKRLYYNPEEEKQLSTVSKLIKPKRFNELQKTLKTKKMPIGLTVLLYGAPGTGKTESIYQFAKQTNRNIFKVDISETKSMWFGESQKLIKKIFTDYKALKAKEENCPILMLNEADGVIGKRKAAGSSAVADTENQIQNILLEELENFDGILFATTNLINNLDSAFERRFLFKINFSTPSPENAARIWKSKLPFLKKKETIEIAKQFQFSGGEIENIARKCEIEELVFGEKITFEKIIEFCQNEKWNDKKGKSPIGFVSGQ